MEEEMAKKEVVPDFLAPFISQLLNEEQLSAAAAEAAGEGRELSLHLLSDENLFSGSASRKKKGSIMPQEIKLVPTARRARMLRQLCLADFKRRMVDMANLMQASLEKVSSVSFNSECICCKYNAMDGYFTVHIALCDCLCRDLFLLMDASCHWIYINYGLILIVD